jgi:trimeric autotransporter adhesin
MQSTASSRRTTSFFVVFTLCAMLLSSATFMFGRVDVEAATLSGEDISPQTHQLGSMLKPDGTLDIAPGFSGSVDVAGYTMETGPSGAPVFERSAPQQAADDRWKTGFGAPGIPEARLTALAVAANGDIYVGGDFDQIGTVEASHIARWDGQEWHALGAGLTMQPAGTVRQIVAQGSDVYVVGDFTRAGTQTANNVARWNGTAWQRIGSGVGPRHDDWDPYIYALAVSGSDVYVGGIFTRIDGVAANNVARWNGTAWSALGEGIRSIDWDGNFDTDGTVYTLALRGTNLYAGGRFSAAGMVEANSIARWNGTAWSALGTGLGDEFGVGDVYAIAFIGSTVFAGGEFISAGGEEANNIAAWNGSTWSALDLGVTDANFRTPVSALLVRGTDLLVGGAFTVAGGETRGRLARWAPATQTWSDVAPPLANRFDDDAFVEELALAPDGSLVAAGAFDLAGDLFVSNIAQLRGTAWETLGKGVGSFNNDDSGTVRAMAVDAAGRVYIGGDFLYAGGVPAQNLAMWDGSEWSNIGDTEGDVRALLVANNTLYVAGEFSTVGGVAAQNIAQRNLATGQWSPVGNGTNGTVYALAWSNGILYAGGDFTGAGDVTAYDLAYWNGSRWSAFGDTFRIFEIGDAGSEVGTLVYALAVQNNTVIIGGHFQTVHLLGTDTQDLSNYRLVNNVVGWERTSDAWFYIGKLSATEEPGVTTDGFSGFGTDVQALAINGSDVYIGGDFNQAGTVAAARIVRWSTATSQWSQLGSGMGGVDSGLDPTSVWGMVMRGSDLYVTGHFTTAGNTTARFVARYDTRAGAWATLGSGLRWYNDQFTYGYALAVAPNAVYVGGVFTSAGLTPSLGFAQWTPEQSNPNPTATGTIVTPGDGETPTVPPDITPTVPPDITPTSTTQPTFDFEVYLPLTIR